MNDALFHEIADADWPVFGWADDVRPALAAAIGAGRAVALATLYKVEGSAPRGPGAQMLFDGPHASGYFSGDCIEGDVAGHAAHVLADGQPRRLHYGMGSPWIDIRLRCGGALHVLVERVAPDSPAAAALIAHARERRVCRWISDGVTQRVEAGEGPLLALGDTPFAIARRYDPPRRLIVSGGDPGALALARLGSDAQFETILVRPGGPDAPPPFPVARYLRAEPADALAQLGIDRWTAYVGATHEDHHDLGGVLQALRRSAGYVAMIGARSRAEGRLAALRAAGASEAELARLHLTPGIRGLGKAPWEVATGILVEVMQALNPPEEHA
ncbi:XdhC family protein [Novosphingobium album (ex Liu et al. 2023)]|uniref:XdhC family protein n=1 Tax=Novosphingobium album (ex Liu et al. 2023) TaxID=3031130 RepID=A0ABT5WNT8_9SPHN|nr:XdhC family protein [Novosphingobium album (ex Liu et al. 2023)]MDE8650937.1 XdhC family protein [Novosphingobium album (ex Liu et al. 2023)]